MNKIVKAMLPSSLYRWLTSLKDWYMRQNPVYAAKVCFKYNTGRELDLKHPKDLNEKINWLKFYGDASQWPRLADKWAVRSYVEERGLGDILVKEYGHWDKAEDIDFDSLPVPCVLKANHGSGMNLFLTEKPDAERMAAVRTQLTEWMNTPFCDMFGEPHYGKIKPCILAEQMLVEKDSVSSSLIDYKVFAFDGKPAYISTYANRKGDYADGALYDCNWAFHPEFCNFNQNYGRGSLSGNLPRPACLEQMLEAASVLSKGHPQVRVDFYVVDGKLYFGEMTMSSHGGYMKNFTHELLLRMGDMCKLPIDKTV